MGIPQWSEGSSDRPQWTPTVEPRSWFEKQASSRPAPDPAEGIPGADRWRQAAADNEAGWRPVSDLTDTSWGLDGAWRDPSAQWNVAGVAPEQAHTGWNTGGRDDQPGRQRWDTARWDAPAAEDRPGWHDAADDRPRIAAVGPDDRFGSGYGRDQGEWNQGDTGDRAGWDPATGDDRSGWAAAAGGTDPGWGQGAAAGDRAGWDRDTGDLAGWDRDTGDLAGWDRDRAWGGDPGRGGRTGWSDAPTDAAWSTAGSPVALLERPQTLPEQDAPDRDAPAPERKHTVRHPLRIGLFALVLFGLVAGSVAWLSMDKSVTLTVDGEARAVTTYASTVGGVLDDQNLTVGQHDTLAPARDTRITDGAEIVLRRGRLLTLTVDGQTRQVWTTATTVRDALDQIGYRQANLWMSSDRSTRLPLDGYQLSLRMPKSVTVVANGTKRTISTTAATVGAALDQAGIDLGANDKLSPLSTSPVRAGMTITLTRLTTKTTTTEAVVQYKTIEKTDPNADPGSRKVQTKGVTGLQQVTTVMTYVDGKLTSSKVTERVVVKKPVDEVVVVGPEQESAPPVTQPAGCADFPTTGGLNWCGLAQCESGLNPNAYNPAGPYYGLYQFDVQTWQANGGTGTPSGKSIAEQTRVAYNLYQARGRAPWPVCGKNL
ncbi:MAG TPA: ubiquitin-like domain-containing protein [Mycobacteriales bacterium]